MKPSKRQLFTYKVRNQNFMFVEQRKKNACLLVQMPLLFQKSLPHVSVIACKNKASDQKPLLNKKYSNVIQKLPD